MEHLRKPPLWGAVLLVAVGLLTFGKILTYDFAAWDTFPLIAASRIGNGSGLGDVLLSPLMGPYFPYGQYYRPTVHLSFAIDHALWGLNPLGYHLTDLLLYLLDAVLVFALVRRVLPAARLPAAIAAAAVLLLHPSAMTVVPVIPRRIDLLAGALMVGSLLCLLRPARSATSLTLGLVFGLGALGSKESALCLPVLHGAWVWLGGTGRGIGRLRESLEASWPLGSLAAAFFVVRWIVLGGLGGVASDAAAPSWALRGPVMLTGFLGNLLFPLPNRDGPGYAGLLIPAAVLVLVYAASRVRRWRAAPGPRRVALFGLLWLGLLFVLQLPLGATPLRLTYLALVPFAMLMAAALDDVLGAAAARRRSELAWGAIPVLLFLSFLAFSPLLHTYAHPWKDAGSTTRRAIDLLDPHLASRTSGQTVSVDALPSTILYDPARFRVAVPFTTVLAGYSVRAWSDLRYPGSELDIEVRSSVALMAPVDPERITLVTDEAGLRFEYGDRP